MDFRIYAACLTVVSLFHGVHARCVQDTVSSPEYTQCMMGYSMYMANAASSADPNDPMAMMAIMCSTEGKAAAQCVLDFISSCPELMTAAETSTMFQGFKEMEKLGGFQGYCTMASGPCASVNQCMESQNVDFRGDVWNFRTPFSSMQLTIGSVCGPVKALFGCFKDVGDQCQDLENNIRTVMDMSRKDTPEGTTVPSYEELKMFVKKDCPHIPQDFGTSSCLNETLMSDMFFTCMQKVYTDYPRQKGSATVSCDAYRAGHKCISSIVGNKCGQKYTDAFVRITPLFLAGVPSNCKVGSDDTSAASSIVQMSAVSLLLAAYMALKLK